LGSCSCGIKRALSLPFSLSLSLSLIQRQETLYGITPLDCPPISLHSFAFLFLIIIPSLHTLYTSLLINSKLPGNSQKNKPPIILKFCVPYHL
jgi:hypothetical protein